MASEEWLRWSWETRFDSEDESGSYFYSDFNALTYEERLRVGVYEQIAIDAGRMLDNLLNNHRDEREAILYYRRMRGDALRIVSRIVRMSPRTRNELAVRINMFIDIGHCAGRVPYEIEFGNIPDALLYLRRSIAEGIDCGLHMVNGRIYWLRYSEDNPTPLFCIFVNRESARNFLGRMRLMGVYGVIFPHVNCVSWVWMRQDLGAAAA